MEVSKWKGLGDESGRWTSLFARFANGWQSLVATWPENVCCYGYGHAQNIPSRVQLLSFRGGRSDLDGHWSCRKCVLRIELMGWRPCAASSSMEVTDGITVRSFVEGIGLEYLEVVAIIPSSVD